VRLLFLLFESVVHLAILCNLCEDFIGLKLLYNDTWKLGVNGGSWSG
jgi:hypothetical protein